MLNKTQPKDYYQNFLNVVEKTYRTYNFPLNKTTEGNKINNKNLSEYVFDAFRDVSELILVELEKAQDGAQKNFNRVLLNAAHNPHITLFLTFIKLLEQIDTSFYKIINRHLEYYYEGVLMFKKKKEKKDKTLIFCIYDEINNIKTLPKFTKILGGKDNKNQDIIFQTDETTQISNLKIKTIRTILYSEITLNNIDKFPTSHIEIATYDMFDVYSKNQKLYLFSKKDSNAAILSKSKNKNSSCPRLFTPPSSPRPPLFNPPSSPRPPLVLTSVSSLLSMNLLSRNETKNVMMSECKDRRFMGYLV